MARWTRLELATPCVTGRYSNQLNYHRTYNENVKFSYYNVSQLFTDETSFVSRLLKTVIMVVAIRLELMTSTL